MPGAVCSGEPGLVLCDSDNVTAGSAAHATIVVRPTTSGSITSTLTASSPLFDPNVTNNTASVTNVVAVVPVVINVVENIVVTDAPATAAPAWFTTFTFQ